MSYFNLAVCELSSFRRENTLKCLLQVLPILQYRVQKLVEISHILLNYLSKYGIRVVISQCAFVVVTFE
eukprot:UN00091